MAGRSRGGKSRTGVPTFHDLVENDLKSGDYRPFYLLVGEDTFRAESVVQHIRSKVLSGSNAAFNYHVLQGDDATLAQVLQQAASFPMLGGRQLVWLRHADRCVTDQLEGEALLRYVRDPVEQTILVLTADGLDRRRKWVKEILKLGCYYEITPPKDRALVAWISAAGQRAGVVVDLEVAQLLADLVGGDLQALSGEIDKLALLSEERGRPLARDEVAGLVMDQAELSVFEISAHLEPGQAPAALDIWQRMRQWGKRPEQLVPMVVARVKQASLVAGLLGDGLTITEIQQRTGMNRWALEKYVAPLARRLGKDRLAQMLEVCRDSDRRLKSSPIASDLVFEHLLLQLCASEVREGVK